MNRLQTGRRKDSCFQSWASLKMCRASDVAIFWGRAAPSKCRDKSMSQKMKNYRCVPRIFIRVECDVSSVLPGFSTHCNGSICCQTRHACVACKCIGVCGLCV